MNSADEQCPPNSDSELYTESKLGQVHQVHTLAQLARTGRAHYDECLKHSDYTRVSLAFSCCFGIIYIVLGVRSLI